MTGPSVPSCRAPCVLRVKPAIFDLLLAVCIGAYLGTAYTAVQVSSGPGALAAVRGLGEAHGWVSGPHLPSCPQNFGLLYKTVQRLLVKAKTQ